MKTDWEGIFPALTTQFAPDGALDLESTRRHADALIEGGIHGLVLLGTVGENCSLELEEKLRFLEALASHAGGRVPVLTGVAEYTTALAARFARAAESAGADGLMVLPAMVYRSDARETIAHLRAVAAASALPVMVYNNPVSYGVDITPAMLSELSDVETIVAVKEASEDVRRITDLHNELGDRYVLFGGVDDLALESFLLGARGWISGLVNAFPRESRALWDLARAGEWERAREIYRWFTPLLHLDTRVKLVQAIKLVVAECGLGAETTRPPRLALEGEEREEVLALTRRALQTRPELPQRFAGGRGGAR